MAQPANVLLLRGPECIYQMRQAVKKCIPEAILRARDARQEQQRIARFRHSAVPHGQSSTTWTRRMLAGCYLHSPLPSLAATVRNRYRLHVPASGGWSKMRWHRRKEPSLRILYYHRVNDDNDLFFPSLSTAEFERQMRFLARHHRVLSLSAALRMLTEGGPPEPVIAITFDDGYKDNYLNAFPILRRYGLPATIFLTTGSIDSREALWFEKLALAFKTTSQPFIDLEIDSPTRFPLQTGAERVRANDRVFGILRTLPDGGRRRHLDVILAQLNGSRQDDRNDKMLTWDQVREMHRHDIEFGGHTVTHPFISQLVPEQAVWEVSECKRRIENQLQAAVDHFAYPNGREPDFRPCNKVVLQEAGYKSAVSTQWGMNYPQTDRMELRRGTPWEEGLSVFAAKLDWYQWADA